MTIYTCDCCGKDKLKHKDIKDICTECFDKCCKPGESAQSIIDSIPKEDQPKPANAGEQMTADKIQ